MSQSKNKGFYMKQGSVFMFFLVFHSGLFCSDIDQPGTIVHLHKALQRDADRHSGMLAARAARAALSDDDASLDALHVAPTWGEAVSNIHGRAQEVMEEIKSIGEGRPASLSCVSSFKELCEQARFLKRHYSREMSAPGPLIDDEPMIDRNFPPGTLPKSYFDDAIRSTLVELVVASHGSLSRDEIPSPLGLAFVKQPCSREPSALSLRSDEPADRSQTASHYIDLTGLTPFVPVSQHCDSEDELTCVVPPNTARQGVVHSSGQ